MGPPWPVIVVTGANSGVGFGICYRLLVQLSQKNPPDAQPQFEASGKADALDDPSQIPACEGLTLIMACRSTKRAEVARTKLYHLLDTHINKQRKMPGYDGHAQIFRENLKIEIHYLDLAIVDSVFRFGDELSQKYPYVSHLICNAGVASFVGMDWPVAIKQLMRSPIIGVTAPEFYLQSKGEVSVDGLGWVWQCNLFGHYVLFRTLQALLSKSASALGSRVIWMSSLEASPKFYESEDWQLIKTEHSYEATKYQIDLIATHLDRRALQEPSGVTRIRHVIVEPGVVSTNISHALIGWFLDMLKVMAFYMARVFGSPHHTIDTYKSAIAAVHVSLVSFAFLPILSASSNSSNGDGHHSLSNSNPTASQGSRPIKFGSETDRRGKEYVGCTEVKQWETHKAEGATLLERCERLFQSFWETEGRPLVESASEHM